MDVEEMRRKQREKIRGVKQRQQAMERYAEKWDPVIKELLREIGVERWGEAARGRHWHGEWEVHAATPEHPYYRVSLKLDDDGVLSHFVVTCAAGELETDMATEEALTAALERATEAGPAGW